MAKEAWKPITESDGYYEVSSLGRVRRLGRAKHAVPGFILKPTLNRKGYATYTLCLGSKARRVPRTAHRLVAEAFIGPRPAGATINHIDADKLNNAAKNLEYVSNHGNILHAVALGLRADKRGMLNGAHKLEESSVREIRSAYAAGVSSSRLAHAFNVSTSTVWRIVSGRLWRHLD